MYNQTNRSVRSDRANALYPAFTLIEVLVVVAIIALLIAILMPSLRSARNEAKRVVCQKQLHQVGTGLQCYFSTYRDSFPDPFLLGRHVYRRAPGEVTPGDRNALPETYGMAAALQKARTMPGKSPAWICPDAPRWMVDCKNTYGFAYNTPFYQDANTPIEKRTYWDRKYSSVVRMRGAKGAFLYGPGSTYPLIWDNYTVKPGLTGFFGPFTTGYTISANERFDYPHAGGDITYAKAKHKTLNCLYIDLRVAPRKYE